MIISPNRKLLITGMLRSGTTLLDKVLNTHPNVTVASQPLFQLFVEAKLKYHAIKGRAGLPLSPGFLEDPESRNEFARFLTGLRFGRTDIAALRVKIPETNHRWSPAISAKRLSVLQPGTFFEVLDQCLTIIDRVYGKPGRLCTGIKEVLCEEFLPMLIGNGFKGIIIYRDPRAVICSATTGDHERFVGKIRPILLDIRNWRKSVAYLITLADHPQFLAVCYEHLVADPAATLEKMARFLNVEAFPEGVRFDRLNDQEGKPWSGNSSADAGGKPGKNDIHRWRRLLSPNQIAFIEYCCWPEMKHLGYDATGAPDETIVHAYADMFSEERNDYATDHHLNRANRNAEIDRFRLLYTPARPDPATLKRYFLDIGVWRALKNSLDGSDVPEKSFLGDGDDAGSER